ncbi:MAG: sorbosone dehydrogenase family protein [Dehalococcoidia bacterium]
MTTRMMTAMRRLPLLFLAALPVVLFVACGDDDDAPTPTQTAGAGTVTPGSTSSASPTAGAAGYAVQKVADGYKRPTFVTNAGDGSGRLFVLEKQGVISVIDKDGKKQPEPFLDITSLVLSNGNEQGLLGLAFHPGFATNGRFFVDYTAKNADNTVAEFHVATAGGPADSKPVKTLFAIKDIFPNHNGGMLAFGPDGYLYISTGDGGSSGDPNGNGQNLEAYLGKILRVDVDSGDPYGIPPTNPFAKIAGARSEIWAYGLRNPWRFSFDSQTGDLWIGDVGQNKYEEIDFQLAADKGGANYGWNIMEGLHCYKPATGCDQTGLVKPIFEYDHGSGCSVTGGYVYRGKAVGFLSGKYLFTDYCGSTLWATTRSASGEFATAELGKLPDGVTSFGVDEAGELYFVTDSEGGVYRFVPK